MVKFFIIFSIFGIVLCNINLVKSQCALSAALVAEIRSYEPVVNQIFEKVLNGDYKGKLFDDTATFVDTIGARVVGSEALQKGIDYILDWMRDQGAVAALVAAVSNQAMDLPHTGRMTYDADESIPRIPMASISVDAAQMLGRMQRRGSTIKLRIVMEDENPGWTKSQNTFGQLTGSAIPDEKVIVSGHIDSWDVGQGAQDDGGAVVMSVLVISLLKSLNLTPRRTIQAVGWTSEENGLIGVQGYIREHIEEINAGKIAAAFESDSGLFTPLGYGFAGTDEAACIVQEILKLFARVNFTEFSRGDRVGSDVSYLSDLKVPTFNFVTDDGKYFWYHHADADAMSALNTDDLDKCLAAYAASAYVIADLSQNLLRSEETGNGAGVVKITFTFFVFFFVLSKYVHRILTTKF